jgi:hypothetical protein
MHGFFTRRLSCHAGHEGGGANNPYSRPEDAATALLLALFLPLCLYGASLLRPRRSREDRLTHRLRPPQHPPVRGLGVATRPANPLPAPAHTEPPATKPGPACQGLPVLLGRGQAPDVRADAQPSAVFLIAARVLVSMSSVWRTRSASCSWVQLCSVGGSCSTSHTSVTRVPAPLGSRR